MSKPDRKSRVLKFRITESEYDVIAKQAAEKNTNVSEVIRNALFQNNSEISSAIHNELLKQELFNLMHHVEMPKKSRETILKELNKHD